MPILQPHPASTSTRFSVLKTDKEVEEAKKNAIPNESTKVPNARLSSHCNNNYSYITIMIALNYYKAHRVTVAKCMIYGFTLQSHHNVLLSYFMISLLGTHK